MPLKHNQHTRVILSRLKNKQTKWFVPYLFVVYFPMKFILEWHFTAYEYSRDHTHTLKKKAGTKTHKRTTNIKKIVQFIFHICSLLLFLFNFFHFHFHSLLNLFSSEFKRNNIIFLISSEGWYFICATFFYSFFLLMFVLLNIKPKFMECWLLK